MIINIDSLISKLSISQIGLHNLDFSLFPLAASLCKGLHDISLADAKTTGLGAVWIIYVDVLHKLKFGPIILIIVEDLGRMNAHA